jgi:hypothetical protein
MNFIYLHETEPRNLLQLFSSGAERRVRGREDGGDLTNVQYKFIWNCHYESSHTTNISQFFKNVKEKNRRNKLKKKSLHSRRSSMFSQFKFLFSVQTAPVPSLLTFLDPGYSLLHFLFRISPT